MWDKALRSGRSIGYVGLYFVVVKWVFSMRWLHFGMEVLRWVMQWLGPWEDFPLRELNKLDGE